MKIQAMDVVEHLASRHPFIVRDVKEDGTLRLEGMPGRVMPEDFMVIGHITPIGQTPREKHIKRHKELHLALDELAADFIFHTDKLPSDTTLMEFMRWAFEQTKNPTGESRHE